MRAPVCLLGAALVWLAFGLAGASGAPGPTAALAQLDRRQHASAEVLGQLAAVHRTARTAGSGAALASAREFGLEVRERKLRVVVEAAGEAARAAAAVERLGGSVEAQHGGLVQALVPATALARIAADASVRYVRPPARMRLEAITGEGVAATNASALHAAGTTGAGVKVAIVDGGFAGYAARLGTELPASVTTADFCAGRLSTATPHGTAVAEVVHEVAPGAQLYLICVDSEVTLAQALAYAKQQGIRVVNHSVGWFNTSRGDGSGAAGSPDAIVADARASGILWVNAAGNEALAHWSGPFVDANRDDVHEFGGDPWSRFEVPARSAVCADLKWDDWPVSSQDFDLYLIRQSGGELLASSENDQSAGPIAPVESLCWENTSGSSVEAAAVVAKFSAVAAPRLDLFVGGVAGISPASRLGSVVEPASSPLAFAVGAACWQSAASSGLTEALYSSLGPTIDGRRKPDVLAWDSVSSSTFGSFSGCGTTGFAGTSAAAPHAAGAAALLLQRRPMLSVSSLGAALRADGELYASAAYDRLGLASAVPGRQIAHGLNGDIYVANEDGSGRALVTGDGTTPYDDMPRWSPDGTRLVFARTTTPEPGLYAVTLPAGSPTRLTREADRWPDWSPDGSKIAFARTTPGGVALFVANADGGGATQLAAPNGDEQPSWSPDGSKIAFASARTGGVQVFVMNADGSGITQLTSVGSVNEHPDWSPDGTKIAFASSRDGRKTIYVMNADDTSQTRFTSGTHSEDFPTWSPDGTELAYSSWGRAGALEGMYARKVDGSGSERFIGRGGLAAWRPGVAARAPANLGVPLVDGTARAGQRVAATAGRWIGTGPITAAYQWRRCTADGGSCADVGGATDAVYLVTPADVGATLLAAVTASNAAGTGTAFTARTVAVVPARPFNSALPAVGGEARVGATLVGTPGVWSTTAGLTYGWQRCDADGASCSTISGAAGAAYIPTLTDLGARIRAFVTATNGGGSGIAISPPTSPVAPAGSGGGNVPPGGSGGGSGGGGGGGSSVIPPDLVVSQTASTTSAAVGDVVTYRIRVAVENAGAASGIVLTNVLPAGAELVSASADRGAGCSGSTTLTCQLDFLSGSLAANVTISAKLTQAGTATNTASVRANETDPDMSDNASSTQVTVGTPSIPPSRPPANAAPKLRSAAPVRGSTGGVSGRIAVSEAAALTAYVRDAKTGRRLRLFAGSRLGSSRLTRAAGVIGATAARASTIPISLRIAPARGRSYELVVVAVDGDGKRAQLRLAFRRA